MKPKKPNGFEENPSKPKKPDNDKEDEKDNDNEEDNEDENGNGILNNADVAKIDELMIQCLNTTNTNSIMECVSYLDKIPIDVIEYVLKKTSRISYPNWSYAMSILEDYKRKNIDTVEKAKADDLKYKGTKTSNKTAEEEFLNEQN